MTASKTNQDQSSDNFEDGFSFVEIVVSIGLMVALSVGGFIAYNSIMSNAKQAAVNVAASNVYTAALAYEQDGDPATNAQTAVDNFNAKNQDIKVEIKLPNTP